MNFFFKFYPLDLVPVCESKMRNGYTNLIIPLLGQGFYFPLLNRPPHVLLFVGLLPQ